MSNSTISKAVETNKILFKAGTEIVKTSFKTTQTIANLYKNAGFKAFGFGKNLLKETLKLALDNQKVLKDTSVKALKETVEIIRERPVEVTEPKGEKKAKTATKKTASKKAKKEVTIDDLLNEA